MSHKFRRLISPIGQTSVLSRLTVYLLAGLVPISAAVLAGVASGAAAQAPSGGSHAKHGEIIFNAQCIGCHNKQTGDTTPFGPPNLHGVLSSKPPVLTPQQAAATIKQGKGVMPPFAGKLSPADINDVVAYLKTM